MVGKKKSVRLFFLPVLEFLNQNIIVQPVQWNQILYILLI